MHLECQDKPASGGEVPGSLSVSASRPEGVSAPGAAIVSVPDASASVSASGSPSVAALVAAFSATGSAAPEARTSKVSECKLKL